jgi:hypothetical protein
MKQNRKMTSILTILSIFALALSACGAADEGPVTFNVTGMVDDPLALSDAGLHKMDVVTLSAEHPKNGMQEYTGVRISELLAEAGVQAGAATLVLTASDGYSFEIDFATVQDCADCLIGFSETAGDYMAVMPGQASKAWVKGLVSIELK